MAGFPISCDLWIVDSMLLKPQADQCYGGFVLSHIPICPEHAIGNLRPSHEVECQMVLGLQWHPEAMQLVAVPLDRIEKLLSIRFHVSVSTTPT